MKITVWTGRNELFWHEKTVPCAIGRSGAVIAREKREGDGATPLGTWPLRLVYFRPDRIAPPKTAGLPVAALKPTDGWCDEIDCPNYNTKVNLPHAGSHESLWREDNIYDIIVPLGYNDAPIFHGKGSAIFLHLAREGYPPTEGCIAISQPHLLELLEACDKDSTIEILP